MDKLALSQVAEFCWSKEENEDHELNEDSNSLALHTTGDYGHSLDVGSANVLGDLNGSNGMQYPSVNIPPKIEDNGLVLPAGGRIVNQGDGSFELIIDVDSEVDALKYMKDLKKRNKKKLVIRQADGPASDDDDDDQKLKLDDSDSEGINSDLDDSDSLESEDDSDEQEGNIMLCLYDKVQRVKNKWKCNLREGVASLNGRDYTFQKATSESEW